MSKAAIAEQHDFLYQQVADRLEQQISNGLLKSGDKLLSVRTLSKEQGISMSTAFQAYAHLEMKGLVEARPKSGYYVRFTPGEMPHLPQTKTKPQLKKASVNDLVSLVMTNRSSANLLRLSKASPATELIPVAKLNKTMLEALRRSPNHCTQYEELQGNELLRQQIARLAFNWGGNITDDDVVTTHGCMEALFFCLKAVTKPGDTVAIDSPNYFGIFQLMQSLGLHVLEIPTDAVTGPDLDYLEKALNKMKISACLLVSNFNNPVGSLMPDEHKKRVVNMLAKQDIPLIEDDIYGELYFGKTRPRTCKSFDKKGLVMLCSSVSKSLTPGYRVGWCIPGRFKEEVLRMKLMHSVSSTSATHTAIGLFFEHGRYELHLRKIRKVLHTQCLRYTQAINAYFPEGTKISRPQGGYILWIELPPHIDALAIFQEALDQGISISPGHIFSTDARYDHHIRISFGRPYDHEVEKALKTLGKIVKGV